MPIRLNRRTHMGAVAKNTDGVTHNERPGFLRTEPYNRAASAVGRRTSLGGPKGRPADRLRALGSWRVGRGNADLSGVGISVRSALGDARPGTRGSRRTEGPVSA